MTEDDRKSGKMHWRKRFNYAADAIEDSLAVKIFGAASVLSVIDGIFHIHETLIEANIIPEQYVTIARLLFMGLGVWFMVVIFLIAEQAGLRKEKLAGHLDVHEAVHSVIHETRDCLLSQGAYQKIVQFNDDLNIKFLHDTIASQLGMMERAFLSLTGNRCSVVLKTKEPRHDNSDPGLISVCYGPSSCIDRRKESTIIPYNQGIAHEAVIKKKIAFSNDILNDPRFWPIEQKESFGQNRYRTIVACPIIMNKVVCGVLCFDWKEPNMYCKEYNHILACFADIVSLACYICHESRTVAVKN